MCYISMLCRCSPLIFNAFPSVLVCNPDLFFFFLSIYEFRTAVYYCCLYLNNDINVKSRCWDIIICPYEKSRTRFKKFTCKWDLRQNWAEIANMQNMMLYRVPVTMIAHRLFEYLPKTTQWQYEQFCLHFSKS